MTTPQTAASNIFCRICSSLTQSLTKVEFIVRLLYWIALPSIGGSICLGHQT